MTTEILPFTTEEAWLAARARDLTSTESAALFGMSPYMTQFELWHRKKTGVVPAFEAGERVKWGNHLEAAIARGIAEQQGWEIRPMKEYMRLPDLRIGASFDFVITNHPSGEPAHLEIKNLDYIAFKQNWVKNEDGSIDAAEHIELQVQHQLLVSGFPRAYIGALVGGNRGLVLERPRDEPVIAGLKARIAEFWASIDSGAEPPPVFPEDAQAIIDAMRYSEPGKLVDATSDGEIAELCAAYREAASRAKNAEEDKKVAQAKLLMRIGDAERVLAAGFKLSATIIADSPGTTIDASMIGTCYGARRGYRRLTITPTKENPQ